jgi:hypothetical protein
MSTKSSLWHGTDEKGAECHIYWELAERTPRKSAPIYLEVKKNDKRVSLRLPKECAMEIRGLLDPDGWEVE